MQLTVNATATTPVLIMFLFFGSDSSNFSMYFSTWSKAIMTYLNVKPTKQKNIIIIKWHKKSTLESYIWMVIGVDHSNNPDVTIKPRSEMPFMYARKIWFCRIGVPYSKESI